MEQNRGVALILALLVLAFLSVLGGALLATSTIDIWISDNFKTATQSLYLAEAGIDDAREVLRASGRTATQWLSVAAGPDGRLLTGDDVPIISSRQLLDVDGHHSGSFVVWLRNDAADTAASIVDSNGVLTLTSLAQIGTARKTIETTIQKGGFPESDGDPRLKTVLSLESLVTSIHRNATDVYSATTITSAGAASDYRVITVDGNLDLGPGTGYGILLIRGELNITGDITWNGLVLVIGQGVIRTKPGVAGMFNGGLFVAQTLAPDGTLLNAPAGVVYTITSAAEIKAANRLFPYNPIAIKEQ